MNLKSQQDLLILNLIYHIQVHNQFSHYAKNINTVCGNHK